MPQNRFFLIFRFLWTLGLGLHTNKSSCFLFFQEVLNMSKVHEIMKPYRARIDALDDQIVDLMIERLKIIREVAAVRLKTVFPPWSKSGLPRWLTMRRSGWSVLSGEQGEDDADRIREIYALMVVICCDLEEEILESRESLGDRWWWPMFENHNLMAGMTALVGGLGYLVGGQSGLMIALFVAGAWISGRGITATRLFYPIMEHVRSGWKILPSWCPWFIVWQIVPDFSPKVFVIENAQPMLFATGRNSDHAAVAVTTGLMQRLDTDEIEGSWRMNWLMSNIGTRWLWLWRRLWLELCRCLRILPCFWRDAWGRWAQGFPWLWLCWWCCWHLWRRRLSRWRFRSHEYEADRLGAEISGKPRSLYHGLGKISGMAGQIVNRETEDNPASALFVYYQSVTCACGRWFVFNSSFDRKPYQTFVGHGKRSKRRKVGLLINFPL